MRQIECPYCISEISPPADVAGRSFPCPECDGEIQISLSGEPQIPGNGRRTGSSRQRSGYVQQVKVVAILMIVQGSLECLVALGAGIGGPLILALEPDPNAPPLALFIGIAVAAGGIGISRIIAGILNLKFRARIFGIVTHFIGFLTACTFYCAPTAIGIAIYGLIVYLNHDVVEAFNAKESRLQDAREHHA